jgi:hypothetical protein
MAENRLRSNGLKAGRRPFDLAQGRQEAEGLRGKSRFQVKVKVFKPRVS